MSHPWARMRSKRHLDYQRPQQVLNETSEQTKLVKCHRKRLAPIFDCVAARETVVVVAAAPCIADSTAERRRGTGAIPPAVTRTNARCPVETTARATSSTSGHSAWVRLIARCIAHARPVGEMVGGYPFMISPTLSMLSALPFAPSPNSCVTVKSWRRLVVIVASYARSAAAMVEGCGATHGPRSNATP